MPVERVHRYTRTVVVVLVVGLAARLATFLAHPPLWLDELKLALAIGGRGYAGLAQPLPYEQVAPIPFLWISKLATRVAMDEWTLRAYPLLIGCVGLVFFVTFVRAFAPRHPALLALVLLAITPIFVTYACELKPYGSDAVLCAAMILLTWRWRARLARGRGWIAYGLAGAMLALFVMPSPFVLVPCGAALVIANGGRAARFRVATVVAVWGALFALPYLAVYRHAARIPMMARFWENGFLVPGHFVDRLAAGAEHLLTSGTEAPMGSFAVLVFAAFIAIGTYAVGARLGRVACVLLLGPLVLVLVASAARKFAFAPRLLMFELPSLVVLFTNGVWWIARHRVEAARPTFYAIALFVLLPVVSGDVAIARQLVESDGGTRAAVEQIMREAGPGASVYVFPDAAPAWVFYSTDWRAPDDARLRFMEHALASDGPAYENAVSAKHVQRGTNADLVYRGARQTELIGTPTGTGWPWLSAIHPEQPDDGYAVNELERLRRLATPAVWFFVRDAGIGAKQLEGGLRAAGAQRELDRRYASYRYSDCYVARWSLPREKPGDVGSPRRDQPL